MFNSNYIVNAQTWNVTNRATLNKPYQWIDQKRQSCASVLKLKGQEIRGKTILENREEEFGYFWEWMHRKT